VAEPWLLWEVPELIAALDPGIAGRMLAAHPEEGWCRSCRVTAPCSSRTLAAAADRAGTRPARGHGDRR